jgi:hypothetical protein
LSNLFIEFLKKSHSHLAIFNAFVADVNTKGSTIIKVSAAFCFIFALAQFITGDMGFPGDRTVG